ncbi:hypothetical protein [Streptomyces cadmiisoli]|uniref:hypothetical protein n=1 Tax=Streptomyces cadmiisoli TaxID=2184053 RepID=UPI00365F18F2
MKGSFLRDAAAAAAGAVVLGVVRVTGGRCTAGGWGLLAGARSGYLTGSCDRGR